MILWHYIGAIHWKKGSCTNITMRLYRQSRGFLGEIHLYGPTGLQQCTQVLGSLNTEGIHAHPLGPVLHLLTWRGKPCLHLSQALCAVGTALMQEPVVMLGQKRELRQKLLRHQDRKRNLAAPWLPTGKPSTFGNHLRVWSEPTLPFLGTAVPHRTHNTARTAITYGCI